MPRRFTFVLVAVTATAALAVPPGAAQQAGGPLFDQFNVEASALPVGVGMGVPTYLPLEVTAGLGFTGVNSSSSPQVRATAEPVWAPVLGALDLLGGPGVLVPIVVGMVPQLVPSLPAVFGGSPLPIPELPLPTAPTPPLPMLPSLQCIAATPGDTPERNCGVPSLDLGGVTLQGVGAEAVTAGDSEDISTVMARAEVNLGGADTAEVASLGGAHGYLVHSRTQQHVDGGELVASAETAAADVDIFGAIQIEEVKAKLSGRLSGVEDGTLERECTVGGATLMGVPLKVTQDGLRLASEGVGADANQLLALAPELSRAFQRGMDSLSIPYEAGTLTVEVDRGAEAKVDNRTIATSITCLTVTYRIEASATQFVTEIGRSSLNMSITGGFMDELGGTPAGVIDVAGDDAGIGGDGASIGFGGLDVPGEPPSATPGAPDDTGLGADVGTDDEVAADGDFSTDLTAGTRRADWTLALVFTGLLGTASVLASRLRRLHQLPPPAAWEATDG